MSTDRRVGARLLEAQEWEESQMITKDTTTIKEFPKTLWTKTDDNLMFPASSRVHYTPDMAHEALMLLAVCDALNELFVYTGEFYRLGECWMDCGARLWWQTIVVDQPKGKWGEYQLLCPRDHALLTCGDPVCFAAGIKNVIEQQTLHFKRRA
jgi:hypothetical protein